MSKVTVVVRIKAKAGEENRVEEELLALLPPSRAESGCINFDLHRAIDDDSVFLVHENWVTEEDLGEHFKMSYIEEWLIKAEGLLAEPMELTRWQQIG